MADRFLEAQARDRQRSIGIQTFTIDNWRPGQDTERSNGRQLQNSLPQTHNVVLGQDGVVQPRDKLVPFGDGVLPGRLLGKMGIFYHENNYYLVGCFFNTTDGLRVMTKAGEEESWLQIATGRWRNAALNPIDFDLSRDPTTGNSTLIITGGEKVDGNSIGFVDLNQNVWEIEVPVKREGVPHFNTVEAGSGLAGDDNVFHYHYGVTEKTIHGETALSFLSAVPSSKVRAEWNAENEKVTLDWRLSKAYALTSRTIGGAGYALLDRINYLVPENNDEPFTTQGPFELGSLQNTGLEDDVGVAFSSDGRMFGAFVTSDDELVIWEIDPEDLAGSVDNFHIRGSLSLDGIPISDSALTYTQVAGFDFDDDDNLYILITTGTTVGVSTTPGIENILKIALADLPGFNSRIDINDVDVLGELSQDINSRLHSLAVLDSDVAYVIASRTSTGVFGAALWRINLRDPDQTSSGSGRVSEVSNQSLPESWSGAPTGLSYHPDGTLYALSGRRLFKVNISDIIDSEYIGELEVDYAPASLAFSPFEARPDGVTYNLYAGLSPTDMSLLEEKLLGTRYVDRGQKNLQTLISPPVSNSTELPDVQYVTTIADRVFLFGDRDNPNRIWHGGIAKPLQFAVSLESNFIEPSRDPGVEIVSIEPFVNDSTNASSIAAFGTQGAYGRGFRYTLNPKIITLPGGLFQDTFSPSEAEKTGTNSPYGVVAYQLSLIHI